jgi:outer membrane protein OmpA-like peptidoglycan-associated protein
MYNKLLLSIFTLLFVLSNSQTQAQNYAHKMGFEVHGGINEYGGDRGTRYFFASKPIYNGAGAAFGYYLNPSFDGIFGIDIGELGHMDESFQKEGFRAQIWSVMPGVRYKLANNKLISEQAKLKPYLQASWGLFNYVTSIRNAPMPGRDKRSFSRFAVQWAAGGGVKYALTNSLDLTAEVLYNYTYDDNMDGLPYDPFVHTRNKLMDAYLTHRLGLAFNFGSGAGTYVPKEDNDDVPEELKTKMKLFSKQIQFETAKSVILPESYSALDSMVMLMLAYPTVNALVEGHTDNVGDPNDNLLLSQQRADAVLKYLTDKNVDPSRLTAQGFGETQPISTNKTPEGRALNRRCVVKAYYKK